MTKSQRPQTTKSGRKMDGRFPSGTAPQNKLDLDELRETGTQYGWYVTTGQIRRRELKGKWKSSIELEVICTKCGDTYWRDRYSLMKGQTTQCQPCAHKAQTYAPRWLMNRVTAMQSRCVNPSDPGYRHYGGRGIEFRFASVREAVQWIQKHLGEHRDYELDRTDNDGHYEAGNLRYADRVANSANKRNSVAHKFNEFRALYPEVRYADTTLRGLLGKLTFDEVVDRWNTPSCKPKGKYGTFSTLDTGTVLPPKIG